MMLSVSPDRLLQQWNHYLVVVRRSQAACTSTPLLIQKHCCMFG